MAIAFGQPISTILSYPPELISLVHLKDLTNKVLLYPDPPIGQEELALLTTLRPDLMFTTPALLPLVSKAGKVERLKDLKVAISLSETGQVSGFQDRYIQDLMVELTRYLLVSGCSLIYSGNINYSTASNREQEGEYSQKRFNFAQLFIELIETYRYDYQDKNEIKAVSNYSAYPLYTQISTSEEARLKRIVDFISVPPPTNLKIPSEGEKALKVATAIRIGDSFRDKYVWAKSLSAMRKEMMQACDVLLVLGGKGLNFKGKLPGVLEETLLALQDQKPLFLIGGYGGVAADVIEALQGRQPDSWTNDYFHQYAPTYLSFLKDFNQHPLTLEQERVDYSVITTLLNQHGQSHSSYGLYNGLSKEENDCLFKSHNEIEIISLVLKGLNNINTQS